MKNGLELGWVPDHTPKSLSEAVRKALLDDGSFVNLTRGGGGWNLYVGLGFGDPGCALEFEISLFEAVQTFMEVASTKDAKEAARWLRQLADQISGE
ncbi:hypothetical protein C4K14_2166 [Pseudomonas chlororaphis subsp. aureofaciens]|uniref:hypothetical protein n=1 Tax=Pseudomonas chlororaphis TaxID=587753 RepID=UPI000F582F11|nr:hypothetical protein [Pseudomonas chlororaphis]AZD85000.1 hypothetical protein C4K14_2166 [Pseudomonas chlororaphis subsp. aureofaciens]